jgi:hypothetical protein
LNSAFDPLLTCPQPRLTLSACQSSEHRVSSCSTPIGTLRTTPKQWLGSSFLFFSLTPALTLRHACTESTAKVNSVSASSIASSPPAPSTRRSSNAKSRNRLSALQSWCVSSLRPRSPPTNHPTNAQGEDTGASTKEGNAFSPEEVRFPYPRSFEPCPDFP